jgi:hypothetical protein
VVALQGDHSWAGHALLLRTVQHPILSAICLGPMYLPRGHRSKSEGDGSALSVVLHSGRAEGALAAFSCENCVAVVPVGLSKGGGEVRSLYAPASSSQTRAHV